jgi:sugar phosphate isomerase/epimerase
MQTASRSVEIARILGIPKIRTFTDAGPDALPSEKAAEAQWAQCIKGLREIAAMAPELDFVVETHNNSLANSVQSCRRIIRETNVPNLHLNFQHTAEFLRDGYMASFDALFPWITHMHLAQAGRDHGDSWMETEGLIDFPALFRHLKEKDYRGTFSIEYCWQNIPWERAESAFQYVRKLL